MKYSALNEIWKDIKGFEGLYQISNYGRLKSFKVSKHGIVMSVTNKNGWYLTVRLSCKERIHTARIHRLVAEAFIPNPNNFPIVNHKDGNKQNNYDWNLEWCTGSYNVKHSMEMHPEQCSEMIHYNKHVRPRPIAMLDKKTGAILRVFSTGTEAGRITGICTRNILQTCNREKNEHGYVRKSAGGYVWRFESEVKNA